MHVIHVYVKYLTMYMSLLFSVCFLGQNPSTIISEGALDLLSFEIILFFQLQEIIVYQ